jgi:hypothetical protein
VILNADAQRLQFDEQAPIVDLETISHGPQTALRNCARTHAL